MEGGGGGVAAVPDAGEQVLLGVMERGELGRVGLVDAGVRQAPHPGDESEDLRGRWRAGGGAGAVNGGLGHSCS
jgi:hypothetical protein